MHRLMIIFLGFWQLLGTCALVPFFDGPWSPRSLFYQISPRDQKPSDRTVSIRINERQVDQLFYGLKIAFGTPPQEVVLAIESLCPFETWMPSSNDNYTNATILGFPDIPHEPYVFDANASSTVQEKRSNHFQFSQGPSLSSKGHELTDNGTIGGASFGPSTIRLVTEGNRIPGDICFDDIGRWLKKASAIDDEVYSIWLNGPGSGPGDVLLGGVDTEKFQGNMTVLPALTTLDFLGEGRNFFNLASMTVLNGSETVELLHSHPDASFEMDYGRFSSSVPPDVFAPISKVLGGVQLIRQKESQQDSSVVGALLPCSRAHGSVSLNLTFGYNDVHTSIALPISEFMSSPETTRSQPRLSKTLASNSTELCLFNLWPGSRGEYLSLEHSVVRLGTAALRSVYAVVNRANQTIGVAQARPNVTRSNIVSYNQGCFPGAQFVNSSSSSACAPSSTVATALPTEIFTNTPTHVPVKPTSTSSAANLQNCRFQIILALSLPFYPYVT